MFSNTAVVRTPRKSSATQQRQSTYNRNAGLIRHHSTVPPPPHHGCEEQSHWDRSKNQCPVILVREYQLIPAYAYRTETYPKILVTSLGARL
jgi:hypothetical protein